MIIDKNNYEKGNKAMASVLLLYYHLLKDGGFGNDQNVYIDINDFDAHAYLNIEVSKGYEKEIDESLLREGAVIYLLCDVFDVVTEYEDDYLKQDLFNKVYKLYKNGDLSAIPEVDDLFGVLYVNEENLNYPDFNNSMRNIYNKYVVSRFLNLAR